MFRVPPRVSGPILRRDRRAPDAYVRGAAEIHTRTVVNPAPSRIQKHQNGTTAVKVVTRLRGMWWLHLVTRCPVAGGGECDTENWSVGDVLGSCSIIVPLAV